MKQSSSRLLGTLCLSILAGCAGSGKSLPPGNLAVSSGLVRTTVSINIAAGAGAQGVRPKYVSPSTLGVAITIYGALATPPPGPTTVANLSAGSSLCTSNPDGSRTCTVSVLAPIGNDNFIVTTYDQPPSGTTPQGNILSTTTLQFVIVAGQTNTVPLTLNGVPATIVLSPPGFLVPPSQTNTFTFNVNAKDAGGNYIIGPGNYTQPIALVVANDPKNTISLSTTSISSPATTSVTGTYNGGSLPGIATITGSASGAASGTTTVQSSSAVTQVTVVVPPAATTASQAQQVLPQSGFWSIPGVGGFTGSITYSTNNAPSGATATITSSTTVPGALSNPPSSGLLYVSFSLAQAATFTQGIQSVSVTLPSSVTTSNRTFYETVYDLTTGTSVSRGPNSVVNGTGGQVLTFGPGPVQNPTAITFPASETYLIVISVGSTAGTFSEYAVPTANSQPFGIAAGPDGNVWFVEQLANKIGKITPNGVITEYVLPTSCAQPTGIIAGPDGNLWFTEENGNKIGKITTSGMITEYTIPIGGINNQCGVSTSAPGGIAAGSDGNLWFSQEFANAIGKITPSGTITEYAMPAGTNPSDIAAGPDGNLWFTGSAYNPVGIQGISTLGKITTSAAVTLYTGTAAYIAAGPDGNLWFTDPNAPDKIGRITTGGTITEYPVPTSGAQLNGIGAGPEGNLWFTEIGGNKIGQITPSGTVTEYAIPTSGAYANQIVTGPDGNMWFTEYSGNKIGKLVP